MERKIVLLILDGWGIGRKDYSNPIHVAQPPRLNAIRANYRSATLQSSGISVGLPWGEEGSSEVGHLTIGAGKVIYQHFPRITLAINDRSFFKNPALVGAVKHATQRGSALHLAGLLTEGNVHASLDHIKALIELAKKGGVQNLNLHLWSDGKDSPPKSLLPLMSRVRSFIKEAGVGRIASVGGRFYALDRDEHWTRTKKAYEAMVGAAPTVKDLETAINEHYGRDLGDEFIEPCMIGPESHPVREHDALIFFDFREDNMRQIASPFILKGFDHFPAEKFEDLAVATMTNYSKTFSVPVAFPNEAINAPLGKILADSGRLQLHIAETEKYAHITYFFNGYREEPFPNEYRVLIPSRNVAGHDEAPEMMAHEVAARIVESVEEGGFDFILGNLANADVIAHTGNFEAATAAVKIIDEEVGRIVDACLAHGYYCAITSDHGNIERMINPMTGRPETTHNANLVPFYLVGSGFEHPKNDGEIELLEGEATGMLGDVAPTILELFGIPKPEEMTGESLLRILE